jgi:pimeloyl-ACP methyl ester carboxylesterase
LDSNVWGNVTSNDLKRDAEKALDVLIQQPEVAANRITVVGHSEGTTIAPRIVIDKPDKVQNIVLMGAIAQNLSKIAEYQAVGKPLLYAKEVLDRNHDGLFSLQEANKDPIFRTWFGNLTLFLRQNITNTASKSTTNSSTTSLSQQQNPKYNTNNGAYVDIDKELKPKLLSNHESHSVVKSGKRCIGDACPIWQRSVYASQPTLNIIDNVSSNTSILILQGENDSQTPVEQAFLLQQTLIDKIHPDHTLITYPNLGHLFYPSSQWFTALGPIQPYVLADLYAWLEAHNGFTRVPSVMPSSNSTTTK